MTHQHEPVGSIAEEAAKLFSAFGQRASALGDAHIATGGPECTVCPVCQIIGAIREARPELVEHLGSAAVSMIAAAKSLLEAAERQAERQRDRAARRPANGFEHIDIG